MMQILKNHKWAIFLALAAAIIIAYPQAYFRYDNSDVYQGIGLMGASDDEENWASRVREVQDGHPFFANTYSREGKDEPYLFQPLGTMIVAFSGKLFSLDIDNTILFSRFFFNFLVFLAIYGFLFLFTKEKLIALSVSSALLLAFNIFESLFARRLIINDDFLNLTRPVNPTFTWLFFFGFLLFFWLFLDASARFSARKKQWIWGGLSALMLGLSFYDYFYTWTFLYAFCGALGLIFLLRKKWSDVKKIGFVLSGAAVIAIPFFINLYQVVSHPNYAEVSKRFGMLEGRFIADSSLALFIFILFLLFFPKKEKERFFFALSLLVAPFIVLNQQLITSKTLSIGHYHWYYHKPLAVIFLLIMLFFWISRTRWQFIKKPLAVFIIAISFINGIFIQNNSYAAKEKINIERQKYGPLMDWLNRNAGKEEVVLTNSDEIANLILIYTPLNLLYHPAAGQALAASQDRLLDIIFLFYRLDGVKEETAKETFLADRKKISQLTYIMYYQYLTGDESGIPDEIILKWSKRYRDSFAMETADFVNHLFQKYEIKYLVWDKKFNPNWQLDGYSFLKKAAEIGEFAIYER